MVTSRTTLLGRKAEYLERIHILEVEVDTAAKGIMLNFEPFDRDLAYVRNILPDRLKVNVCTIEKKIKELNKILGLLKEVDEELGQSE